MSRSSRLDSRLIVRRHAQPRVHRATWGAVTVMAWLFYAYLWLPLATAAAWSLGLLHAYRELYSRSMQLDPFFLVGLPAIATTTAFGLIVWAEYNRLRFAGNERRAPVIEVPIAQVARRLGAPPTMPEVLDDMRIAILDMDAEARPLAVVPILRTTRAD